MLLAVVYGLVPVYAKEIGMSVSQIGTFMAVLIFGGFSLQWPLGRWADRGNRRRVLNFVSLTTSSLGIAIAMLAHVSPALLLVLAWLFGGFSFTLYPLSMAYACERVKEDQIVAATGGFVLSYGMGAIVGPLIAPVAMGMLGGAGVFYFISMITFILWLVGLKRPAPAILE
jgi:MFS family permease